MLLSYNDGPSGCGEYGVAIVRRFFTIMDIRVDVHVRRRLQLLR